MKKTQNKIPRTCQPCTGCCDGWVQMTINGADVYPGSPCPHSTHTGCDDYHNRPKEPCQSFICGWITPESPLPDWMKPSNAKVIVIFNKLNWGGISVDLAVPMGKRIPPRALNWLKAFSESHYRPLIYTQQVQINGIFQKEQELFGYGPPEFQALLAQWREEGRTLW